MNLYETLLTRGYIFQTTHENEIKDILNNQKIHFYIGIDPTADSLHVGHFVTAMVMSHLQKAGHVPISVIGGGTAMVGDPSGRSDIRQMLTKEQIQHNSNCIKSQLSKFISFENGKGHLVNNSEWLLDLNYVTFLRNYGSHFSVNRMITADAYKNRLEKGLTFLEFNYQIMQAYDFLELSRRYNCILQIGGSDQWSNIISGVELIRRVEQKNAYGLTLSLLVSSTGQKMGKTAKGALWLDKDKTSPYEFYQYFRNVDDESVINCLKLLTFVDNEIINELAILKGKNINKAKILLAYEVTKLIHGEEEANSAQDATKNLFENIQTSQSAMPTIYIEEDLLNNGYDVISLLIKSELCKSRTEAKRLILQNGIKIDNTLIESEAQNITLKDFTNDHIIIQKGKKTFCKIVVT